MAKLLNSPAAWFALLERARRTGDTELERRAMDELKRLGVDVRFRPVARQGGSTDGR
jgi:hypothetical protein